MLKRQYTSTGRQCALLVLCVLCLQGCAAIPPVVDYASMALSGISYISTSKGPSDHAISYVAKKDCSLFRLLLLKQVCVPVNEDTNKSLIVRIINLFRDKQPDEVDSGDEQVAYNDADDITAAIYDERIAAKQ